MELTRVNRIILVGETAATTAHEVNQPLAATVTNAKTGLRWLAAHPPEIEEAREALGRIVSDSMRAGRSSTESARSLGELLYARTHLT